MPELRKDPIVGRWVIIATDRAKRPIDLKTKPHQATTDYCPFCEGHEDKTPPEIIAYRDRHTRANGPGWRVRVVPNKFPALQIEGNLNKRGDGIYDRMQGVGAHEVIIETPRHEITMARLSENEIREVLWAYRDRLVDAEARIPADTRAALAGRGHQVNVIDEWSWVVGGGQGIARDLESGALRAGADPRRDGYALAI